MEHIRKPEWLKIQIGANARYADTPYHLLQRAMPELG